MSRQIIKQPNGKYCIYSTISDSIEYENLSRQDVLDKYRDIFMRELEQKTEKIENIIHSLDKGNKPYYQFTKSYKEIKNKEER